MTSAAEAVPATPPDAAPAALSPDAARQLDLLWAVPARPRRGPKPSLSLAVIVETACGIADADGLAALSMARIAEALGVTTMALYRYVESKDDLLALMADAAVGEPPAAFDAPVGPDWRPRLELWTRAQIEIAMTRPWLLDLIVSTYLPGPNRLAWMDRGFACLAGLPLALEHKLAVLGLLGQHVLGQARVEIEFHRAALAAARRRAGVPEDTPESDLDPAIVAASAPWAEFEQVLGRYADPAATPALLDAAAQQRSDSTPTATSGAREIEDVGFGIAVVLDGIEALIARLQAKR